MDTKYITGEITREDVAAALQGGYRGATCPVAQFLKRTSPGVDWEAGYHSSAYYQNGQYKGSCTNDADAQFIVSHFDAAYDQHVPQEEIYEMLVGHKVGVYCYDPSLETLIAGE